MTILWIYNMPLIPEAGGTERITSLVAKGLSERGHNCMGILEFKEGSETMFYEGKKVTDLYAFLKDSHVDVVINQIAYSTWLLNDFLQRGGTRWHDEGGKIISCLHFDPCNPSFTQLFKSKRTRTLRNYFDVVKHLVLSPYYKQKKERLEGVVYNYIYDNSDTFVVLSERHKPYMNKVMKRNYYQKIVSINNPLTFSKIVSDDELGEKEKTVLVCARMSEYHKRISIILRAWHILNKKGVTLEWKLKIVGDGPDLDLYKQFVINNGLDNVEFYGRQNPLPFYTVASILLLTSSAEGWGLVLTEALQNGVVPVVMNSSPVYADIIENGYNGYLTPNNDIKSFISSVETLITDSCKLQGIQRNALRSAHNFTINKIIDQWQNIL